MIKFMKCKLSRHVSDRCTQLTLLTSTGLDKIFEDMSQTSGTPLVSGTKSNSTPTNVTEKNITLDILEVIFKTMVN